MIKDRNKFCNKLELSQYDKQQTFRWMNDGWMMDGWMVG